MFTLHYIGAGIERTNGVVAAAILFFIPAVGGTILSAILLPESICVGASGGVFGYKGACLADIVMNWSLIFGREYNDYQETRRHIWMIVWLFVDIAMNCFIDLTPFVDNITRESLLVASTMTFLV